VAVTTYTKFFQNTNSDSGASIVPASGFPSTQNQQTARSASSRQIRRAEIHLAEAMRLLLASRPQAPDRGVRLVAAVQALEEETRCA
jgi:hypothetical protein